jgi:hypothetical protein
MCAGASWDKWGTSITEQEEDNLKWTKRTNGEFIYLFIYFWDLTSGLHLLSKYSTT